MSSTLKTATSIILYLLRNSTSQPSAAWIYWRETVLAAYERKMQGGLINAEINSGKINSKKINEFEDVVSLIKGISEEEQTEIISLLELYKVISENSADYIPETFNNELFAQIINSISDNTDIRKVALENAQTWFRLKKENRFHIRIFVPASIKPILLDFVLRCIVLWIYQKWVWELFDSNFDIALYFATQVIIIPTLIFVYAILKDKAIVGSTQLLIDKINIKNIRIRIKNTAWHYLLLFVIVLSGSVIMLIVRKLEIDAALAVLLGIPYGIYLLVLQTNFSKQAPTYLSIKQQITDKEHKELSGELTPDQNDEEIINLEVNLKAENERMNAYVIEAALFGALAFSGYLQLVAAGNFSFTIIEEFNFHLFSIMSNFIDASVENISLSYSYLLSKNGILTLLSYQSLFCSVFFLAVIASRLRFSKLTDYIDRYLQLSKAMNIKEENLLQFDKTNTDAINYYNVKIKDMLREGYKKQAQILPIMEYMQFFRTLGIVTFFIIIITGGLFISPWISLILFFISVLSLFYFHLGKLKSRLKSFYISMQEFYYRADSIPHWLC